MRSADGDDGFTLIDTLMATVVMTIVMAVFTGGVVSMYRTARDVDARSVAQTQISVALQRLDQQVRYAVGISREYGSGQYVDFLSVRPGLQQCVQVRVVDGVLAERTWTYQQSPPDFSGWTALATGVTGTTPFTQLPPTPTLGHQQLKVSILVTIGNARQNNDVTFTALNSNRTNGNDYCSAGR